MLTHQFLPAAHGGWVRGARLHSGHQVIHSFNEILTVSKQCQELCLVHEFKGEQDMASALEVFQAMEETNP